MAPKNQDLSQRTLVDQVEIVAGGHLQLRLVNQVLKGDRVIMEKFHRTSITPGSDVAKHLGLINDHLVDMGHEPTESGAVSLLQRHAAIAWTPDKVSAEEKAVRAEREPIFQEKRDRLASLELDHAAVVDKIDRGEMALGMAQQRLAQIEAASEAALQRLRQGKVVASPLHPDGAVSSEDLLVGEP